MVTQGAAELADEARFLHHAFFQQDLPGEVVQQYVAANQGCLPPPAPRAAAALRRIVAARLDAEAIELVLRLHRRDPVLTKKIHVLFYLVEVRAQYYHCFVNEQAASWQAVFRIAAGCWRTVYKYVKGAILIRRYELF